MPLIYYCLVEKNVEPFTNENVCTASSCYGEISDYLEEIYHTDFQGIYLNLEYHPEDEDDSYYIVEKIQEDHFFYHMSELEQKTAYRMYEEVAKPWVDKAYPGTVVYKDNPKGIFFDGDLPFFYVVMITSFFRLRYSNKSAYLFYDYFREVGYSPMVALFMAMNCHSHKKPLVDLEDYKGTAFDIFREKDVFLFNKSHEHMPFHSHLHKEAFQYLCKFDPLEAERLPSMKKELLDTEGLTYYGRDEYFCSSWQEDWEDITTTKLFSEISKNIEQSYDITSYVSKEDVFKIADELTKWEKEA